MNILKEDKLFSFPKSRPHLKNILVRKLQVSLPHIFSTFFQLCSSAFQGLNYIFFEYQTRFGKLIWTLVIFLLMILGLYWCIQTYQNWDDNPVLTTITTSDYPVQNVRYLNDAADVTYSQPQKQWKPHNEISDNVIIYLVLSICLRQTRSQVTANQVLITTNHSKRLSPFLNDEASFVIQT